MPSKRTTCLFFLLLLIVGWAATIAVYPASAVVGFVVSSMNATIGGQPAPPNATLFGGDSLETNDGIALVAIGRGCRMSFGRGTVSWFLGESNEVTVLLRQGNVSIHHSYDAPALKLKIGDVLILPANGFVTLGEAALINGAVVVAAREGVFLVEANGSARQVQKGETITIPAKPSRLPQEEPRGKGGTAGVMGGTAGTGGGDTVNQSLSVASIAANGIAATLSGVAISKATDATNEANAAERRIAQAEATLNEAAAAARAAQDTANRVGCALNTLLADLGSVSPYRPPPGESCP